MQWGIPIGFLAVILLASSCVNVHAAKNSSFVFHEVFIRGSGSYEESYQRHHYKLYHGSDQQVTWFESFKRCKSIGYELVDLSTTTDLAFIHEFVERAGLQLHGIWTSGSDEYDQGNFTWMSNGKSINDELWDDGEPTGRNAEHCVALSDRGSYYRLNDLNCRNKWPYMCKK